MSVYGILPDAICISYIPPPPIVDVIKFSFLHQKTEWKYLSTNGGKEPITLAWNHRQRCHPMSGATSVAMPIDMQGGKCAGQIQRSPNRPLIRVLFNFESRGIIERTKYYETDVLLIHFTTESLASKFCNTHPISRESHRQHVGLRQLRPVLFLSNV